MIDHVSLGVTDLDRSRAFYVAALAPLGVGVVMEVSGGIGFGQGRKAAFWVNRSSNPSARVHVAFVAANRAGVLAFYAAALEAGGADNGPPGLRPHYHPNYYGAFVLDPDGNNIEAVSRTPED